MPNSLSERILANFLSFVLLAVLAAPVFSIQDNPGEAFLRGFQWRNIGPANMGGRISDIQALDGDYRLVVVASASGGVWKTVNAGTTWEPIFDRYGSGSIGAVGLFQQNPDIIWVGTGEANVRNSVGWGDGIYKSEDGGRTFVHMGLSGTHHIAKIATHPSDPEIVYVAAQGHLWGHTGERGLFKTEDGGRTWTALSGGLPDDGRTGCTHVVMDPGNPQILYTAFWERLRRPYRFDSGGPNGGLFKTEDGGQTWRKLTDGLPEGDIGRIGIAVFRKNPRILMVIVEHGFQPRRGSDEYDDMSKLGSGIYRSEDGGASWTYLNRYNVRPFYYSQIYINPLDADRVYVMGTRAMVSSDGGKTLEEGMPGIAGDFHVMWLDPGETDRYYVGNDKGISLTHDHGAHFNFFDNFCISQIYNVSADHRDPYTVYVGLQDNGIWGGPSNSRDSVGITNDHWVKFHSGDGFVSAVDPLDWTTVYSESQGGRIRRNHAVFRQVSQNISPSNRSTVNWSERIPKSKDAAHPALRMNWNTPFIISPHNPRTLYYGANFVFKSVDRGDTWVVISPDLSTQDPEKTNRESGGLTRDVTSAETHCTVVTLSESPLKPGLIWAGTDDGNLQLTLDDGVTWTNLRERIPEVPEGIWVSRVEASHHDDKTCYVTLDGHRSDVFTPYVFRTRDLGKTWDNISADLPQGHCTYVVREDPLNPRLLFVGTEFAAFVSWDGGNSWRSLNHNLPTVAVHDLLIHPSGDLIAGTHGRGVWILDNITPLQQLSEEVLESDAFLFDPQTATLWKGISRGGTRGHQLFIGSNPLVLAKVEPSNSPPQVRSSANIDIFLKQTPAQPPVLRITDLTGRMTYVGKPGALPGINRFMWNLQFSPTEQQQKAFRRNMERVFKTLGDSVAPERKKRLEELEVRFQRAEVPDELNQVRRDLMREFGSEAPSFRFFGMELRGPAASPGMYKITLTVDGESFTRWFHVREDPLLEHASRH
jgi:photosystem II stability/assembly factor-like uncharacterized protein